MTSTYVMVIQVQGDTDPLVKGLYTSVEPAKLHFDALFPDPAVVVRAWIYKLVCGPAKRWEVELMYVNGSWR